MEAFLGERERLIDDESESTQADVVLQVLSHAGQRLHQGDLHPGQVVGRADARQEQDLRRADGTCAEDHLFAGFYNAPRLALLQDLNSDRLVRSWVDNNLKRYIF